jgi:type I restriction enzyme S subunit
MKSPWPTKKLGEICEENIKSPFKVENATNSGEYPFFTSGENVLTHDEYLVDGENIFLATGGYANVKYYNGKASYSTDTWSLKVKDALTKFVFYQILARLKYIDEVLFRGSGLRHLQKKEFLNLEIPLPPFPIQQKIVKILDTIQSAVEIQEKIIEKTKELKKSLMNLLFHYGLAGLRVKELASSRVGELTSSEIEKLGLKLKKTEIGEIPENWEVVKIKDVVLGIEQNDPSKTPLQEIKYIDVSSISNEFLKIVGYKSYLGKDAPSRARKVLKENDIVFATVRPYLKRIAFIPKEYDGFYGSTAFCVLRSNPEKILPYFLFYYVSTDIFVSKVSGYQTGSGYPAITDDNIKNELIPLPPLPEQQEIAEILQTIDQKIEIEKKKKELYHELFKTLLNKIMNQEIDINLLDY